MAIFRGDGVELDPKTMQPPNHKPDAYLLSPKLAKENPDLVADFDKLVTQPDTLQDRIDAILFTLEGKYLSDSEHRANKVLRQHATQAHLIDAIKLALLQTVEAEFEKLDNPYKDKDVVAEVGYIVGLNAGLEVVREVLK